MNRISQKYFTMTTNREILWKITIIVVIWRNEKKHRKNNLVMADRFKYWSINVLHFGMILFTLQYLRFSIQVSTKIAGIVQKQFNAKKIGICNKIIFIISIFSTSLKLP